MSQERTGDLAKRTREAVFPALLVMVLFVDTHVHATTIYYQPTPYQIYKADGTPMPSTIEMVHIWNGWAQNNGFIVQDDKLIVGGQGYTTRAYLKFDVKGLPAKVSRATLWLMPFLYTANTTPYQVCNIGSPWDPNAWKPNPILVSCSNQSAGPMAGTWSYIDITDLYSLWKLSMAVNNGIAQSSAANKGIALVPQYSVATVDAFRSSRFADFAADPTADGHRPVLQLDFTPTVAVPNFKLPLPAGYKWLVTTETGGYDCKGLYDPSHDNANYFSIDFSARTKDVPYPSADIPILAVDEGTVVAVGGCPTCETGYFVTIAHPSGYRTRYLHFDNPPARKDKTVLVNGSTVAQGDQIGIMGSSGLSTGKHLHMNFWFTRDLNGGNAVPELTYVTMEGLLLKSYQTECTTDGSGIPLDWNRYYESTNAPTGR